MKHSHEIIWSQPSPLWGDPRPGLRTADARAFETPSILRFNTDTFMEEFLNLLATRPARLARISRPARNLARLRRSRPSRRIRSPARLLRRLGLVAQKAASARLNGARRQPRQSPRRRMRRSSSISRRISGTISSPRASSAKSPACRIARSRRARRARELRPPASAAAGRQSRRPSSSPGKNTRGSRPSTVTSGSRSATIARRSSSPARRRCRCSRCNSPRTATGGAGYLPAVIPAGKREAYLGAPKNKRRRDRAGRHRGHREQGAACARKSSSRGGA